MPILERISIAGCSKLGDAALKSIFKHLKNLRSLDMSGCVFITPQGMEDAFSGEISCELEDIRCTGCMYINDKSIKNVFTKFSTSLKVAHFGGLRNISDRAIEFAPRYLENLNVSGCFNVTDKSLIHIRNNCEAMKRLELGGCSGFSNKALAEYLQYASAKGIEVVLPAENISGLDMGLKLDPEATKSLKHKVAKWLFVVLAVGLATIKTDLMSVGQWIRLALFTGVLCILYIGVFIIALLLFH